MQQKLIQRLSIALFVALLTWGVYGLLSYIGSPPHSAVLMSNEAVAAAQESCGKDAYFCRGLSGFFSAIGHTFDRGAPLFWYVLWSAVFYLGYLGVRVVRGGKSFRAQGLLKPIHLFLFFFLSVWLLFSVITTVEWSISGNQVSFRRVIEPHPTVYRNVGEEGMNELKANFGRLLEQGCLTKVRDIRPEFGEYRMKTWCTQMFFVKRVVTQIVFTIVLLLTLMTAGRFALKRFKLGEQTFLVESTISLLLGACIAMVVLWVLAVLKVLTTPVGWGIMVLTVAAGYKHARYFLLKFFTHTWEIDRSWRSPIIICTWFLISWLALNYLTVLRPFPIGWDDLGSYLNRPRLMVSYGAFIPKMSSFQWEYISSLGYLLYGYNSIYGSTAAQLINWSAALLALAVIFAFAQTYIGAGAGIIAAIVYYTLPMIGHFSFADMKTDNAVFALQAMSIFMLFLYLFPKQSESEQEEEPKPNIKWVILSGIFCAFAFGTKFTAAMVFMTVGALILGAMLHWSAFLGAVVLGFVVFELQKTLKFAQIAERVGLAMSPTMFIFFGLFVGGLLVGTALWRHRSNAAPALKACGVFVITFLVCIAPWILNNNRLAGNIIPRFELSAPNFLTPMFDFTGDVDPAETKRVVHALPPDLRIDPDHEACQPTGRKEELGRYWGFREGWGHYLTLPWRQVMNADSAGYYVTTTSVFLLFPLLLLLPFFWLKQRGRWLRWLFAATVFLLIQWVFLANGVPWYGICVLLGLTIGFEALLHHAPDKQNRIALSTLFALATIAVLGMRFWQFEQQRNLLEYAMGKASAQVMRERTIPHYDDITELVLLRHERMPERPYLYRIGTFMPYFIPKNLEVIGINDHQVDTFSCLYQERDNQLMLKRLQALGFNSIIFDTNTATIEKDVNGSLHQKVRSFVDWVNDPELNMTILVNDPENGIVFILLP